MKGGATASWEWGKLWPEVVRGGLADQVYGRGEEEFNSGLRTRIRFRHRMTKPSIYSFPRTNERL